MAEADGSPLIQVQHHHAHAAALMAEHNLEEAVTVVCDGYGYGTDGGAWGGEVLFCTRESAEFKRLGHLEPQPLLGRRRGKPLSPACCRWNACIKQA